MARTKAPRACRRHAPPYSQWQRARRLFRQSSESRILNSSKIRAPKEHINIRIQQSMISGIPLTLLIEPYNQNVGSFCLRGCLGPCRCPFRQSMMRDVKYGSKRSAARSTTACQASTRGRGAGVKLPQNSQGPSTQVWSH